MATRIWGDGSAAGADGDWNTAANWTGDTLPANGDDVVFDGAVSNADMTQGVTSAVSLLSIQMFSSYTGSLDESVFSNSSLEVTQTVDLDGSGATLLNLNQNFLFDLAGVSTLNMNFNVGGGNYFEAANPGSYIENCTGTLTNFGFGGTGQIECRGKNDITLDNAQRGGLGTTVQKNILVNAAVGDGGTYSWENLQWLGQTFNLASPEKISCVVINISDFTNICNRGKFKLAIYNTSAGLPTTLVDETPEFVVSECFRSATIPIFFDNFVNLAAGDYAFVLIPVDRLKFPVLFKASNTSVYPNGNMVFSNDSGSSWSSLSSRDMDFVILDMGIFNLTLTNGSSFNTTSNFPNINAAEVTNLILTNGSTLVDYISPDFGGYFSQLWVYNKIDFTDNTAYLAGSSPSDNEAALQVSARLIEYASSSNFIFESLDYNFDGNPFSFAPDYVNYRPRPVFVFTGSGLTLQAAIRGWDCDLVLMNDIVGKLTEYGLSISPGIVQYLFMDNSVDLCSVLSLSNSPPTQPSQTFATAVDPSNKTLKNVRVGGSF